MAKNKNFDSDFGASADTDFDSGSSSSVRDRFSGLSSSASDRIDDSPLIALGAGIALGAVLGATLPISRKERELLEPLGRKLNDAGTSAIDRSRGMAKQKFDEMAGDKVREFLGGSSSSGSTSA
jgi:hypothetical protein